MKELRETVYLDAAPDVDPEAGVIRGVKLLGENSRNGRRYTPDAMRNATALYEGRKLYINHPKRNEVHEDRGFESWAGVYKNVHYREGQGLFGDAHLRQKCEYFEGIIEAAQKFPTDVGLSHVANGDSRTERGVEIVESITEVFSVDLVTDPATTNGFFESRNPTMAKKTVKQIIESAPESSASRKLLMEMEGDMMPPDMPVEVSSEMTADEQIDAAFAAAVTAIVGDSSLDTAAKKKKLNALLGAQEKAHESGNDPEPSEQEEGDPPTEPTEESRKLARKVAMLEAKTMLLESGRDASEIRIKALAACDESDRKSLLESWPAKQSGGSGSSRPASSPPLTESEDVSDDYERRYQESLTRAREKLSGRKTA